MISNTGQLLRMNVFLFFFSQNHPIKPAIQNCSQILECKQVKLFYILLPSVVTSWYMEKLQRWRREYRSTILLEDKYSRGGLHKHAINKSRKNCPTSCSVHRISQSVKNPLFYTSCYD